MKKIIFFALIALILSACQPASEGTTSQTQVTATSTAPVTETPAATTTETAETAETVTANDGADTRVETISQAMQQTNALIEQYKIDPETVTVTEKDGTVTVTDNETEKVLMISTEEGTRYDLGFAVDQIAAKSCESKPEFKPRPNDGRVSAEISNKLRDYFYLIRQELNYYGGTNFFNNVLINRSESCWGMIGDGWNMIYRNADGDSIKIDLIPMTQDEVVAFVVDR